jgi:hypothetical protein
MARFVAKLLEEMESLKPEEKLKAPATHKAWACPPSGWVKINTDAGFDKELFSGRAGVVIRDHQVRLCGAAARWLDDVPDALTAEALAAKEGLERAVELGASRCVLETDCKGLSFLLASPAADRSHIGGICFDIAELGKNFIDFSVVWVSR